MQYSHTLEKASEYATEALERIQKEGLAPTPENYELWYVYYSQMNSEITRAIDVLVANGQKITNDRCRELHQRFLSEAKENERVRSAGDQIKKTIKEVKGVVSSVKDATTKYNTSLEGATGTLRPGMDSKEIKGVLSNVMKDTKTMMKHNQTLERELVKSSVAMEELQRDLELVRKEALTDGLTGIANRKAFDAEIKRLAAETDEKGTTFSLIMLDIDHFKSFNDNFGHQVGDQVLRLVARTLFEGVKGRDVAARYGGEEFAVLLPDTNLQGGMKVGEILRNAVATKDVVNRNSGEKLARITLSAGVAEYIGGEPLSDLIGRADAALYTAKHNGRNQVAATPAPGQKR